MGKKAQSNYILSPEAYFRSKDTNKFKVKGDKRYHLQINGNQKSWGDSTVTPEKINEVKTVTRKEVHYVWVKEFSKRV